MPAIDVTSVLNNPRFADSTLTVSRSEQSVGDNGVATITSVSAPFSGVVTTKKGREMLREGAGSRINGQIQIVTTYVLRNGDVIGWHGQTYTITDIEDWTSYGPGFVAATGDLIQNSGH